jgi:hypothetical protein
MMDDPGQDKDFSSLRRLLHNLPRRTSRPGFEARLLHRIAAGESAGRVESPARFAFHRVPAYVYSLLTIVAAGFLAYYVYFPSAPSTVPAVEEPHSLQAPLTMTPPKIPELRQADKGEGVQSTRSTAKTAPVSVNRPAGASLKADRNSGSAQTMPPVLPRAARTAPQRGVMMNMKAIESAAVPDSLARADSLRKDSIRLMEEKAGREAKKKVKKPG